MSSTVVAGRSDGVGSFRLCDGILDVPEVASVEVVSSSTEGTSTVDLFVSKIDESMVLARSPCHENLRHRDEN